MIAPAAVQAAIFGTTTVSGTGTATCPSGYRVSGGGAEVPKDYYGYDMQTWREYKMIASKPYSTNRWAATGAVNFRNNGGSVATQAYSPKVFAVRVK